MITNRKMCNKCGLNKKTCKGKCRKRECINCGRKFYSPNNDKKIACDTGCAISYLNNNKKFINE